MTAKKDSSKTNKFELGGSGGIKLAQSSNNSTVSTVAGESEPKRANKPLMEKRRRARINQSLAVLKALIVEASTKNSKSVDGTKQKHVKLEKADILEITVREFQRHRNLENPEITKYRAGYSDCAREVARYLATPEPLPSATVPSLNDPGSKSRLLRHLDACLLEIDSEITNAKDHSMTSRDYLRTPSTMHTECSQDSINPLDYSKINHEGALNLTKCPPTLNHVAIAAVTAPLSGDENNNNGQQQRVCERKATTPSTSVTSTSPPLASDNFSSSSSSMASTAVNKQSQPSGKKSTAATATNKAITGGKRNKSFADKNDESVTSQTPIPPKKAMIKSVEKERIAESQAAAAAAAALVSDHNTSQSGPSSPSTMAPQNYVQQLASALGINNNNKNNNVSSNNGTTTANNSIASTTDFESLIEMNRRHQLSTTTNSAPTANEIPAIHSASEWEMYKKILSTNAVQTTNTTSLGLNKAENATSTTLKPSPIASPVSVASIHHGSNSSELDVNDENAPSNFHSAAESNGNDKVIYESPYERPLTSIHTSQQYLHPHRVSPSHLSPTTKMQSDEDYAIALQQTQLHHTIYPALKSIHQMVTTTHYREFAADENLEQQQRNFVSVEEEENGGRGTWRPW